MLAGIEAKVLLDLADLGGFGDAHLLGGGAGKLEEVDSFGAVARSVASEIHEGEFGAGDQEFADVAELFVDGKLFFLPNAQGLVHLSAGLQDVRDLSDGDGSLSSIAKLFVDGKL